MTRNTRRLTATIALFEGATTQGEAAAAAAAITRMEAAHPELVDADDGPLIALEVSSAAAYNGDRARWMVDAGEAMTASAAGWVWAQTA